MNFSGLVGAQRLFWAAVTIALGYLFIVQTLSVRQESYTGDEPLELAAGYSYLKTGDFRINPEHPPLSKIVAALPLLGFSLSLPLDSEAWSKPDEGAFSAAFFRANATSADEMIFPARMTSIFLTAGLGLAIALWTRAAFGTWAAILALSLFCLDPTVAAYGRYIKSDIGVTLFSFLTSIAWAAFLGNPRLWTFCLAGISLGLALATKFSALFLIPVLAVLYLANCCREPRALSWRRGIGALLLVVTFGGCVTFLIYAAFALSHGVKLGTVDVRLIHDFCDRDRAHAISRMLSRGLPRVHPYLEGLLVLLDHNTIGHVAYLFGRQNMYGWWYYFPVAFAVKTPVCTLALLGLAAVAPFQRRCQPSPFSPPTSRLSFFSLTTPLVVFLGFSMGSHLNIGIRYLLPIWPFLFVLAAAGLSRVRLPYKPQILALLCLGLAVESLSIYPDYLAFFNQLAGGPANGPRILLDSNIDWGQDAKKLSLWVAAHHISRLCLDYWGNADISRLGLSGPPLPATWETERRRDLDCVGAISVNTLYDFSADQRTHAWLRALKPTARIGYSIYIYDLRR